MFQASEVESRKAKETDWKKKVQAALNSKVSIATLDSKLSGNDMKMCVCVECSQYWSMNQTIMSSIQYKFCALNIYPSILIQMDPNPWPRLIRSS